MRQQPEVRKARKPKNNQNQHQRVVSHLVQIVVALLSELHSDVTLSRSRLRLIDELIA
jgi:hypothetical protein